MLRTLVLIAVLHGTASADFGEQLMGELAPLEVEYVFGPPPELATALDATATEERSAKFDGAVERTLHPLARANLRLARADLWAARAGEMRVRALASQDDADEVASASAYDRALRDYEVIASSPLAGWRNLDGALARYAFLLEVTHRPENLRIYRRLVTEFPHSPHALRAHLVLGEADRVAKRMTAAYAHFAEAAQPQHPRTIRAYAMYRLGWIELEDRGQGAYAFRLFMHSIAIEPTGLLALELRHGITKSFALFGNPAEAFSTFARVQPDDALEMANELAERLRENHRAVDAVGVLDELVRRAPGDIRACTWQAEATRGALALGDDMLFFRQAERLTQIFERIRHLAVKPDLIEECEAAVVTYTLDAAQTKNTALQRALRDLFVRAFPERAAAAIKRFAPVAPAELAN